jgi:hypothetical protein
MPCTLGKCVALFRIGVLIYLQRTAHQHHNPLKNCVDPQNIKASNFRYSGNDVYQVFRQTQRKKRQNVSLPLPVEQTQMALGSSDTRNNSIICRTATKQCFGVVAKQVAGWM